MTNETEAARNARAEPGPQPDPMLREGRSGTVRSVGITAGIVVVVLLVMYGLTAHRESTEQAANTPAAQPPTIQPSVNTGGRTTGNAPPSPAVTKPAQ